MRKYGIDPYLLSLQAGLGSVMVSDARWNGASMTSHYHLLTEILKGEYAFKGFVATDWEAASSAGGAVDTINAGVDMLMEPDDWATRRIEIKAGVAITRIDDAVSRILTVKCEAGLFGWQRDTSLLAEVGSTAHRELGRRAVRESLVLLQNEASALPLTKGANVWVGGSGADSLTNQCGGWTVSWQGTGDETEGTTVREAVAKVATVVDEMGQADAAVVVLSEGPYAEFQGDSASINTLPAGDFALLAQANATGKPVVAVVFSGRPVLIADHLANAHAWIAAWLPGSEGDGIADVLFGDHSPTASLSHSWPRTQEQANQNMDDAGFDPLFAYGHGLSY
jgi:beta-glucosidase